MADAHMYRRGGLRQFRTQREAVDVLRTIGYRRFLTFDDGTVIMGWICPLGRHHRTATIGSDGTIAYSSWENRQGA
jgi:hypothetical protein